MPVVSVIMPTYKQAAFIRRAIESLLAQRLEDWELLVVDDGSPEDLQQILAPYLTDPRVTFIRFDENQGLGKALNYGLDHAAAPLIAYLPSDDVYYEDHLACLAGALEANPTAALAYSGIRHTYNRSTTGVIEGQSLQLVQVTHRRVTHRWVERSELTTDDLDRMFWHKLKSEGEFIGTGQVSCEWVDHPHQRHKILREPEGGINRYRLYYGVKEPLRMHNTTGNLIDEIDRYQHYRNRPDTPLAKDGLKILLVGELAYNADRILALEELGHQLYGLWMPDPYWYNTVGPLPFGHVQDLPANDWKAAIKEIQPDVIYALLNWQAVPWAHHILENNPGIPFIWHYKEGPFISLEKGHWSEMVDLFQYSDGQIYSSPEMRDWFETVLPGIHRAETSHVLDGDLPKKDWFDVEPSPRLSAQDGEFHTVVPGRPIGLHPYTVAELAEQKIHLHFYGDFTHGQWLQWIEKTKQMAPGYIHLHSNVDQENWVREFSQYDAGWLHYFKSTNQGEIRRANWDDLNYPARIATLAVSGLPMLQRDNCGSIVAMQNLIQDLEAGIFFESMIELRQQLEDKSRLDQIRQNLSRLKPLFTFDYHAPELVNFFRRIINNTRSPSTGDQLLSGQFLAANLNKQPVDRWSPDF